MLDLAPEPFFHFPTATRRDNKDRIWLTRISTRFSC